MVGSRRPAIHFLNSIPGDIPSTGVAAKATLADAMTMNWRSGMRSLGLYAIVLLCVSIVTAQRADAATQQESLDAGSDAGNVSYFSWADRNDAVTEGNAATALQASVNAAKAACIAAMIAAEVPPEVRTAHIASINSSANSGAIALDDYNTFHSEGISEYSDGEADYSGVEISWFDYHGRGIYEWAIDYALEAIEHYVAAQGKFNAAKDKAIDASFHFGVALEMCENWDCYCL